MNSIKGKKEKKIEKERGKGRHGNEKEKKIENEWKIINMNSLLNTKTLWIHKK